MTNSKDTPRGPLDLLADSLIDDLLSASDEEILAEAKEDFGSADKVVAATKEIFERAIASKAKGRLAAARAGVKGDRERTAAIVPIAASQAKQRLAKALATNPRLQNLTMAARHGKSASTSDTDAEGVLEDLIELGLLPQNDDHHE